MADLPAMPPEFARWVSLAVEPLAAQIQTDAELRNAAIVRLATQEDRYEVIWGLLAVATLLLYEIEMPEEFLQDLALEAARARSEGETIG